MKNKNIILEQKIVSKLSRLTVPQVFDVPWTIVKQFFIEPYKISVPMAPIEPITFTRIDGAEGTYLFLSFDSTWKFIKYVQTSNQLIMKLESRFAIEFALRIP